MWDECARSFFNRYGDRDWIDYAFLASSTNFSEEVPNTLKERGFLSHT